MTTTSNPPPFSEWTIEVPGHQDHATTQGVNFGCLDDDVSMLTDESSITSSVTEGDQVHDKISTSSVTEGDQEQGSRKIPLRATVLGVPGQLGDDSYTDTPRVVLDDENCEQNAEVSFPLPNQRLPIPPKGVACLGKGSWNIVSHSNKQENNNNTQQPDQCVHPRSGAQNNAAASPTKIRISIKVDYLREIRAVTNCLTIRGGVAFRAKRVHATA